MKINRQIGANALDLLGPPYINTDQELLTVSELTDVLAIFRVPVECSRGQATMVALQHWKLSRTSDFIAREFPEVTELHILPYTRVRSISEVLNFL